MNFTDPIFVPFLILVLSLFHTLRSNTQRIWLIIVASSVFYAWWSAKFFLVLAFASCVDFWIGKMLGRTRSPRNRLMLLVLSVFSNLGMLFFFKYANFFIDNLNQTGLTHIAPLAIVLPVGVSFFTFETLSYSIDVYYNRFQPTTKLRNFLLFISFFPHLVAGPIVRGKEFLPQLEGDLRSSVDQSGTFLVLFGIAKKLLFADVLGSLFVDGVFAHPSNYSSYQLVFALYCYAFQIFLDFSAYSDIAIGLAKLLGLEIGQNFNAPYLAESCSEFWTRWHISLSTWFRDYLYIPLGGNRTTRSRWCLNIFLVFLTSGLWHGANWRFAVWGALHGFYVIAEFFLGKLAVHRGWKPIPGALKLLLTFNLVCLAWVFFRAETFADALAFLDGIVQYRGSGSGEPASAVVCFQFGLAVLMHRFVEPRRYDLAKKFATLPVACQAAFAIFVFAGCYEVSLSRLGQKAFIYFQF